MKLVPVDEAPEAAEVLWQLLSERPEEARISHKRMPTREEHEAFVAQHPFFRWYLIENHGVYIGAIEATDRNEIGVAILKKHQRKGFAFQALDLFLREHKPLPAIPAVRNPRWLANISAFNDGAKDFFTRMGFEPCQETWILNE